MEWTIICLRRSLSEVSREAGITAGLNGAVQRVLMNGLPIRLFNRRSNQVAKYQGPPCSVVDNPCLNGGLCLPLLSSFACKCHPPFIGATCQQRESLLYSPLMSMIVTGMSPLHYPSHWTSDFLRRHPRSQTKLSPLIRAEHVKCFAIHRLLCHLTCRKISINRVSALIHLKTP